MAVHSVLVRPQYREEQPTYQGAKTVSSSCIKEEDELEMYNNQLKKVGRLGWVSLPRGHRKLGSGIMQYIRPRGPQF